MLHVSCSTHRCLLPAAILVIALAGVTGCRGEVVNGWPQFAVEGRVASADATPHRDLRVQVDLWRSPCSDLAAQYRHQTIVTRTDARGMYRAVATTETNNFTGCIVVAAGTRTEQRDVAALGRGSNVRIDVELP
jgi:hypothetical protein